MNVEQEENYRALIAPHSQQWPKFHITGSAGSAIYTRPEIEKCLDECGYSPDSIHRLVGFVEKQVVTGFQYSPGCFISLWTAEDQAKEHALKMLEALKSCQTWHRADRYRTGDEVERRAWQEQADALECVIRAASGEDL